MCCFLSSCDGIKLLIKRIPSPFSKPPQYLRIGIEDSQCNVMSTISSLLLPLIPTPCLPTRCPGLHHVSDVNGRPWLAATRLTRSPRRVGVVVRRSINPRRGDFYATVSVCLRQAVNAALPVYCSTHQGLTTSVVVVV